jgi:hypothetical protein
MQTDRRGNWDRRYMEGRAERKKREMQAGTEGSKKRRGERARTTAKGGGRGGNDQRRANEE